MDSKTRRRRRHDAVAVPLALGALLCGVSRGEESRPPATKPAAVGLGRPVAWGAVRSFDRVEQRIREFAELAKAPEMGDQAIGALTAKLGAHAGLDKSKPIAVALWGPLDGGTKPASVAMIPVADREAFWETLRFFFPALTEENGVVRFRKAEGGPVEAFGRFQSDGRALRVAASEADLAAAAAVPPDLFVDPETDLVFRLDVAALKQQSEKEWKEFEETVRNGMPQIREQALSKATTDSEKALLKTLFDQGEKVAHQFVDDLTAVDVQVSASPRGWALEFAARYRHGSPVADFLQKQTGRFSRAAVVFSPDAILRMSCGLHMTDELHQAASTLLQQARRVAEEELARKDQPEETRRNEARTLAKSFDLLGKWLAQPELEMGIEWDGAESNLEVSGWVPIPDSAWVLSDVLDLLQRQGKSDVARNVDEYHGRTIHRLGALDPAPPGEGNAAAPGAVFVVAEQDLIVFHVGFSAEPLKRALDRIRGQGWRHAVKTDAMARVEFSLARLLEAVGSLFEELVLQMAAKEAADTVRKGQASRELVDKMLKGKDVTVAVELAARGDAAILRFVLPSPTVQLIAELEGEKHRKQAAGGQEPSPAPKDP